jgi:hypothetical protein
MHDHFWWRLALGFVITPTLAVLFYGFARLVAMAILRWAPEGRFKDRLLTDTATGHVARRAKVRRDERTDRLTLR